MVGPVLDTNPVFDSSFVTAAPLALVVTAVKTAADVTAGLSKPGDSYKVDFTFTFASFTSGYKIAAPYNVVLNLADSPITPIDYTDWVWTAACKST